MHRVSEYDNAAFFNEYAQMPRSREGLPTADEWYTRFPGCDVVKQHHTLMQILMGLLNIVFKLLMVEKAQSPTEMLGIPGMRDELRRLMLLLIKAFAGKRSTKRFQSFAG